MKKRGTDRKKNGKKKERTKIRKRMESQGKKIERDLLEKEEQKI